MIKSEVAFMAVGQAGTNIVRSFGELGYQVFYLNTSVEDLKAVADQTRTYHLTGADGSNRDRNKAKAALADNIEEVQRLISEKITAPIVFVVFASGGGTGSGVSPYLIDILQDTYPERHFCAVNILPANAEPIKAKANAYACCKELETVENMGCTFFIDNEKNANKFTLNKIFVEMIDDFLCDDSISDRGNMDKAEAKALLSTKGAAIISRLGRDKARTSDLIGTFRTNIFAPLEQDNVIANIGIINAGEGYDMAEVEKAVGAPMDIWQGYEGQKNICVLTGLSFPYSRLEAIGAGVAAQRDTIMRNKQAVNAARLSGDFDFLDSAAKTKEQTAKKSSSLDKLLSFRNQKQA